MVMIYLDIETISTGKNISIEDKIIIIGADVEGEKKFWKIWDYKKEEEVVGRFYDFLEEELKKGTVWIIGFNILRFDVPLLFYKGLRLKGSEVFEIWRDCYVEDMRQELLPLNNFKFKGLSADNVCRALRELLKEEIERGEIEISEIKHKGYEVPEFYNKGEYDKIIEHLSSDIDFLKDLHYILRYKFDLLVSKKSEFKKIIESLGSQTKR